MSLDACRNMRFKPRRASALLRSNRRIVIACDRVAEVSQMKPDLMRAARLELRLEQAQIRVAALQPKHSVSRAPLLRLGPFAHLTPRHIVQGQLDVLLRMRPAPLASAR